MFHIYVDVPRGKSGYASACCVSKMLEKISGMSFPQQNRGKISVNIFTLTFPPQTFLEVRPPRLAQTQLFGFLSVGTLKTPRVFSCNRK